jgi:hypothetical protein
MGVTPSLQFSEVKSLTSENVDIFVTSKSPGVYELDRIKEGGFHVHYVGRSDDDVAGRLKKWVGSKYLFFKFVYTSSSKAAFELECQLYHDIRPPDNDIHPAKPSGTSYKCPVAGCLN